MTRIFLYEHITALGIGRDPESPEHSLAVEGRAMLNAIREDFAAIPGVEVLMGERADFGVLAAKADWSFVIAPETDAALLELADYVIAVGGRLLGPSPEAIALTSDKYSLFQHWKSREVPTPETVLCPSRRPSYPCVVKRRDGAGSEGMRIVLNAEAYEEFDEEWIAQPLVSGHSASVSFLIGPDATISLPPTFQCIDALDAFAYRGGGFPIPLLLANRAERLGRLAIAGIHGMLGYIGVDLILGHAADGSEDVAIEINPRLTTSYVGLRAHLKCNLAARMLELAEGRSTELGTASNGRMAFTAGGKCSKDHSKDYWESPSEISTDPTFFL